MDGEKGASKAENEMQFKAESLKQGEGSGAGDQGKRKKGETEKRGEGES